MKKVYHPLPVELICEYFSLGQALALPVAIVTQGLHQIWQLHTSQGQYAIKKFNADIEKIPDENKVSIEITQLIAKTFAEGGIACIRACLGKEGYLLADSNDSFMVFPWCEGTVLNPLAASEQACFSVGQLLANIHRQKLFFPNLIHPQFAHFNQEHWQELILKSDCLHIKQMSDIRVRLDDIMVWNELANSAQPILLQDLVISHRDLDQKNIIWKNENTPVLIDWDYAGWINPLLELFIVALNWSGVITGQANYQSFVTVIAGYRSVLPQNTIISNDIVYGYFGYVLAWIEWNLRRAVVNSEQVDRALREVRYSLTALDYVDQHSEQLLDCCNHAII